MYFHPVMIYEDKLNTITSEVQAVEDVFREFQEHYAFQHLIIVSFVYFITK